MANMNLENEVSGLKAVINSVQEENSVLKQMVKNLMEENDRIKKQLEQETDAGKVEDQVQAGSSHRNNPPEPCAPHRVKPDPASSFSLDEYFNRLQNNEHQKKVTSQSHHSQISRNSSGVASNDSLDFEPSVVFEAEDGDIVEKKVFDLFLSEEISSDGMNAGGSGNYQSREISQAENSASSHLMTPKQEKEEEDWTVEVKADTGDGRLYGTADSLLVRVNTETQGSIQSITNMQSGSDNRTGHTSSLNSLLHLQGKLRPCSVRLCRIQPNSNLNIVTHVKSKCLTDVQHENRRTAGTVAEQEARKELFSGHKGVRGTVLSSITNEMGVEERLTRQHGQSEERRLLRKWGTSAATVVTTPAASYLQSENSSSGADGNISIQSEEFGSETESTTKSDEEMARRLMRARQFTYSRKNNKIVLKQRLGKNKNARGPHHICQDCGISFRDSCQLQAHLKTYEEGSKFPCEFCDAVFPRHNCLNVHRQDHTLGCEKCQMIFFSDRSFLEHKCGSQKDSQFCCKICLQCFHSRAKFVDHTSTHGTSPGHKRETCGQSFASAELLSTHMLQCGAERVRFCCPTCSLIVGTRYQLGIHIKRHTGVTPFACQVCDKHYPAQHELNSHMRTRHPQVEAFKRVPCTTYEKSVSTENVTKHVACIAHKKVVFTKSATEQRIDFFHSDENPAEPTISVNPLREHVGEKATERSVESVREPPSKRMCMDNEPEKYSVVVQNGKAGEMGLGGQGLLSEDQTDPLDDVNSTQAGGDSSQEMQEQENAGESDVEGAITNSEKKLAQGENAAATSKDAQMEKRLKRARRLTFSKKKLVLKTNVMRDQKKKAQYVCQDCGNIFSKLHHLQRHLQTSQKGFFPCDLCDAVFPLKRCMFVHRQLHHTLACEQCQTVFYSETSFIKHDCDGWQESRFKCKNCIRSINGFTAFVDHAKTHHTEQGYLCGACSQVFASADVMACHMFQCTSKVLRFACPKCSFICSNNNRLSAHLEMHACFTLHPCQTCSKSFPSQGRLNTHIKEVHTGPKKSSHLHIHRDEDPAEPQISASPLRGDVEEQAMEKSVEPVSEPPSKRMCMDDEPEKYSVMVQNGKREEVGLGEQGLLSDMSEGEADPLDDVNSTQEDGDSSQEMQDSENAEDQEGAVTISEKKLAQCENAAMTSKDAQMEKRLERARHLTFSKKKLVLKTVLGNKRAQYVCQDCGNIFSKPHRLQRHLQTSQKGSFPCDLCDAVFPLKRCMFVHRQLHHTLACEQCQTVFYSETSFIKHDCDGRQESRFKCKNCRKCLDGFTAFVDHAKTHHTEQGYLCGACSQVFASADVMACHMLQCTSKVLRFACPKCSFICNSNNCLREHLEMHACFTLHPCQTCSKSFPSQARLNTHIQEVHTGPKKYRRLHIHSDGDAAEPQISASPLRGDVEEQAVEKSVEPVSEPPSKRMCVDDEPEKYSVMVQNGKREEVGLGEQGLLSDMSEGEADPLDDVNSTQENGDSLQEMQEPENVEDQEGAVTCGEGFYSDHELREHAKTHSPALKPAKSQASLARPFGGEGKRGLDDSDYGSQAQPTKKLKTVSSSVGKPVTVLQTGQCRGEGVPASWTANAELQTASDEMSCAQDGDVSGRGQCSGEPHLYQGIEVESVALNKTREEKDLAGGKRDAVLLEDAMMEERLARARKLTYSKRKKGLVPKTRYRARGKSRRGSKHVCQTCGNSFREPKHLRDHLRVSEEGSEFPCTFCDAVLPRPTCLAVHMYDHILGCGQCQTVFFTDASFKEHKCDQGRVSKLQCTVCDKVFGTDEELATHVEIHCTQLGYICGSCDKVQKSAAGMAKHMRRCNATGVRFSCPECDLRLRKRCSLDLHLKRHAGWCPHACQVCNKSFSVRSKLEEHIRTAHFRTGKCFFCSLCELAFPSEDILNPHLKDGTCEKPAETQTAATSTARRKSESSVDNSADAHAKHVEEKTNGEPVTRVQNVVNCTLQEGLSSDATENHSDTEVNACNANCTKEEAEEEEVHQLNGQCRPGVGHLSSSSLTSASEPCVADAEMQGRLARARQFTYVSSKKPVRLVRMIKRNTKQNGPGPKYTCQACGGHFRLAFLLARHLESDEQRLHFPCDLCDQVFPRSTCLTVHKENHILGCDQCRMIFFTEKSFAEHTCYQQVSELQCRNCNWIFSSRTDLLSHMETYRTEHEYSCRKCARSLASAAQLVHHMRECATELVQFCCPKCNRIFKRIDRFRRHLREHAGVKPYICEMCGCSFAIKSLLTAHRSHKHGEQITHKSRKHRPAVEEQLPCAVCGKTFNTKSTLHAHEKNVHQNVRPYLCQQCGATFPHESSLKIHLETHSEERPYVCEECGKGFKTRLTMQRHSVVHTSERPYVCLHCGYECAAQGRMDIHMRRHSSEKPFHCKVCPARFKSCGSLAVHRRQHTGEKPYRCQHCNLHLADPSSMRKHLQGVHGVKKPAVYMQ